MIGKTISHYQILEKLGGGGMGVVYKARDTKLDRLVAIKFLPRHIASNSEERERFKIEAKAAAALNHPNIATIHAIEETDDEIFIVMEYIEGQELKEKIKSEIPNPESAIDYAIQIAEGLQAAHKKGIVHRDIKSSNIMITDEDKIKIMDFGLARIGGGAQLTKDRSTLGTVAYMSPEQARGETVDHRTDIWSFGIVLYEMLTGEPPFKGDYEQAVIYSIMNEEVAPLTTQRSDVAAGLERTVEKALAKKPDERYPGVDEFLVDLKSTKSAFFSKEQPTPSRNKSRLHFAFTVFLVLLIAAGWFLWRSAGSDGTDGDTTTIQRLAVLPFTNIREDPEIDFLRFALADQIIGGLTYVKNVLVRPSSAVRQYQDQPVAPPTVGENLKVDFVLIGNYLKEADLVRLNVELVNVHTNEMIWREGIEIQYESAFTLQDIVAEKVVNGLKIQFSQDERDRIQADIPGNPLAYEYYLRGLAQPSTVKGVNLAIELLEKSILLDSTYAPAFNELGFRIYRLTSYKLKDVERFKEAEQAYLTALRLNPELLSALGNLSLFYTEIGKTKEAYDLSQRMLAINSNNALAHFALGYVYRYAGFLDEARAEMEKAVGLDPQDKRFRSLGVTYYYFGEYDRAWDAFEIDKGSEYTLWWKGWLLFVQDQKEQAKVLLQRAISMKPGELFRQAVITCQAIVEGETEVGLQAVRALEQSNAPDAERCYYVAVYYALLGDKTGSLRTLKRAVTGGYYNYPFMLRDPLLDSLRDMPEFQQVLTIARAKHEELKGMFFSD